MKGVPPTALAIMIRNWHAFRLENSGFWTALANDSFLVDSSILKDTIHPESNIQGGRVTKNLEKVEIFITNSQIYLDGISHDNGKHEVEIVLRYDMELTFKLGKALLIDTKVESKKVIRNLEETMFYKLPTLDKCMLSEYHK